MKFWKFAALSAGGVLLARHLLGTSDYELAGKVVVITGGSRGLGLVLAREFARAGSRVAICARDDQELINARSELKKLNAQVMAVRCDVTNNAEVKELITIVEDRFGPIDVLVNNAGVIQVGPIRVMTRDDYEEAMQIHYWGPLNTILNVLPSMRRRKQGRIVNISSIGGKISVPHLVPYSASKFALVGLSEGLRAELLDEGIYVTTVCPGLMRTGSPRNADFKGQHRAEYAWFSIADSLPLVSIEAERAARQIIDACRKGQAELVISLQAKLAVVFHGLFPGVTSDLLSVVDRLLPAPGGIGTRKMKGKDSASALSPSLLTILTERAAVRNNEMVH
jgi:NAD(P)-dependent dehydrogenase (short-subunit alcohol dehydrogenase family)